MSREEIDSYNKAKAASEKIFRRNGWRSIYGRLVDSGFFTVSTKAPIDCAIGASFEDACILISQENAKIV